MARPAWPVIIDDDATGTTGTVFNEAFFTEIKDYINKGLQIGALTELTISSGAVTITEGFHIIDTESDAASDDLDTISGGSAQDVLIIRAANDARTVVVKHNTGNIWLKGKADLLLDDLQDALLLIYDGTKWMDIGISTATDWSGSAVVISMIDNNAAAVDFKEATTSYLKFVTTNGSEKITLGKKLEAGAIEIEGSAFDINGGTIGGATIDAAISVNDDILLALGTNSDEVLLNRSTSLTANTALANVFVGVPVVPALAANSLIISNITADGDIILATQTGTNSQANIFIDASSGSTHILAAGVSQLNIALGRVNIYDDIILQLGTGGDQALLNRSTTLTANTGLGNVLIGTPVTPALAANSLIISNITSDGDVLIAGNDGGNSKASFFFDASAAKTYLYDAVEIAAAKLTVGVTTPTAAQWGYLGACTAGGGQLLAALTTAESTQLEAIGTTTISAAQWGYLGACGAGGGQLLAALTAAESSQLEAIGTSTISAAQWGYLGGLDQALTTGSAVAFTTLNLTGGQIAFPSTQVPSADANTLDDYEEGTWTVGISFGGGTVDITYATQTGLYTKIGRLVTCSGYLVLTNKGTSTGNAVITGLPFTVLNDSGAYGAAVFSHHKSISFANVMHGYVAINTTTIVLEETTEAGTRTILTDANFANDSAFMISFSYFV